MSEISEWKPGKTGPMYSFLRWYCQSDLPEDKYQALWSALTTCAEMRMPPPKWTLEALSIVLYEKLRTERTRGKYGNFSARSRQREIDKVRWGTVVYVREISKEVRTWEDAYHEAANLLKPTIATGSPDRMKASYQSHAARLRKMEYLSPVQRLEFARDYFEKRHDMLGEADAT